MVNSEDFFCRLIGIDTLISFDGIIPSAADFQLRLISLIEQFSKALQEENQAVEESEALCQLLCGYFDKRLMINQKDNALAWERYSLMHYFYGYTQSQADDDITSLLAALLRSDSTLIFRYARKLLALLEQVEGRTNALTSLRATCAPRTWLMRAEADSEPETGYVDTPATSPRLMVLITGPFARKWFRHANLSTSDNGHIVWMVAEHSTTLSSRLAHAEEMHPPMATVALFPVLVDGVENSSLLTEQLISWQYVFTSIRLNRRLPCIPAFYTRLSQQRHSHDPDRAIWTSVLTPPHGQLTLESCFHNLVDKLNDRDDGQDLYAIQRYALGSTFIAWLAESRLMNVMQTLFLNTPLDLAGVMLADYGQGFTRHGAWSQWLAERYGILPALSASIVMPPLPPLPLPPLPEPETAWPVPIPAPLVKPALRRRSPLPVSMALLLLLACLAGGIYYYVHHNIGEIRKPIRQFSPLRKNVAADDNASLFPLADTVLVFANGSSNIIPDSEKILLTIVPAIRRSPEKMFLIIGHSDSNGSATTNMALSAERAQVIKEWLVAHTGLPAGQFITEGAGDTRPVANNNTKGGRAQNRRVEIIPLSRQSIKDEKDLYEQNTHDLSY